jgi:hypothetical protein
MADIVSCHEEEPSGDIKKVIDAHGGWPINKRRL